MADRDKVITQLESMRYYHRSVGDNITADIANDAIVLLKEQEALPIVYHDNPYTGLPVAHCPKCGKFARQYHAVYEEETKFCPYCGQEVKWE